MAAPSQADLFELGKENFDRFVREFSSYGLEVEPALALHRTTGLLCYYDLKDGQIYFSAPSIATPFEKLRTQLIASFLGCRDADELLGFFALFVPRMIAHELGHYFRHHYGLFGENKWYEEQVANQLASAVTKQQLTPAEKEFSIRFLRTALDKLEQQLKGKDNSALAYDNVLDALTALGQIGEADEESMETLEKLFSATPEEILRANADLGADVIDELDERAHDITTFNDEYISNLLQYMYSQMSWAYVDLVSERKHYVDEFAREILHRQPELVARPNGQSPPEAIEIQACYHAASEVRSRSEAATDYFDKRYRSLLLRGLQEVKKKDGTPLLRPATVAFLENWDQPNTDELDTAAQLAPPPLRDLAPSRIAEQSSASLDVERDLPGETDRRLWRHVMHQDADAGAANTLDRLQLLGMSPLFSAVPAEAMIDLVYSFCRIRLAPGETLVLEGDHDNDVYIVVDGQVEVVSSKDGELVTIATLGPGETVGATEFITREPRRVTVRAEGAAECLVIRDADLQVLCVEYPSILIRIAGSLAHAGTPPHYTQRKEVHPL